MLSSQTLIAWKVAAPNGSEILKAKFQAGAELAEIWQPTGGIMPFIVFLSIQGYILLGWQVLVTVPTFETDDTPNKDI